MLDWMEIDTDRMLALHWLIESAGGQQRNKSHFRSRPFLMIRLSFFVMKRNILSGNVIWNLFAQQIEDRLYYYSIWTLRPCDAVKLQKQRCAALHDIAWQWMDECARRVGSWERGEEECGKSFDQIGDENPNRSRTCWASTTCVVEKKKPITGNVFWTRFFIFLREMHLNSCHRSKWGWQSLQHSTRKNVIKQTLRVKD